MRISTNMIYTSQILSITHSQNALLKSAEQFSSGKRLNKPSDNPVAASQLVALDQAITKNQQYQLARSSVISTISQQESVLSNATRAIQEAQVLIVNAGNGTLNDNDRASISAQLQGVCDHLLNLANSADASGRYIFAGDKSNAKPFNKDSGTVVYRGGDQKITQYVDSYCVMPVSRVGRDIFMSMRSNVVAEPNGSKSETNLFTILDSAIAILNTPLTHADEVNKQLAVEAINKTNRGLRNALNNVLSVRSELGTQLSELENLTSLGEERRLYLTLRKSGLEDADIASISAEYKMQETALEAVYKVFRDMSRMSLFQLNS